MKNYFFLSVEIVCFAVSIIGQTNAQNKINGVVRDQNAAAIVGARVFALNVQTRMERVIVRKPDGLFAFDNLIPGDYEIRIAAKGFAAQKQSVRVS